MGVARVAVNYLMGWLARLLAVRVYGSLGADNDIAAVMGILVAIYWVASSV